MTVARALAPENARPPFSAAQQMCADVQMRLGRRAKNLVGARTPGAQSLSAPEPTEAMTHNPTTPAVLSAQHDSASERAAPDNICTQDRELLFGAVTCRLRDSVGGTSGASAALRSTVLECVQALEQLHAALEQDLDRARRSEGELLQVQSALAMAQAELVGTRDGERRARHQAEHDALTALPNRTCFQSRLDDALVPVDQAPPGLAVLFLDLDGFKPINDRHGHAAGDEILRIVAKRLSRCVRAEDLVCRLGGDEFACLLADPMGREQLSQLAAKLFDAVSAPLQVGVLQLTVRPSIGIAICPHDGDTAEALLKRADSAMYRAKRRQLGFAFFDRRADA
jgi:diguanylate cyclase